MTSLDLGGQTHITNVIPVGPMSIHAKKYIPLLELFLSFDLNLHFLTSGALQGQNHITHFNFGAHMCIHAKNRVSGFRD